MIWERLGDCDNIIEPFCGSAAFLLARPHPPRVETLNDADCMVSNFWRATQHDPEGVAEYADGPVNEADLHARHRWLVLSDAATEFRKRMRTDPDYYDCRVAGWWCWGLCCWIGGGWCSDPEKPVVRGERPEEWNQTVAGQRTLTGVHAKGERPETWATVPELGGAGSRGGVHAATRLPLLLPRINGDGLGPIECGVHSGVRQYRKACNRPQLADAYDIGRGVNSHGELGTCAVRRAWLVDWFSRLRDRLRLVRVCCGDWRRVCDSDSVTTRLGTTGIFFDPPYGDAAGRDMNLYAVESGTVAADVRAYCLERGSNPEYRICLAGYAGEGHEELEAAGWAVVEWQAQGGYGNRSAKGKENAKKERLWFSPHCLDPDATYNLFAGVSN